MLILVMLLWSFFFFNDTATTEIYTLSLHDALPICCLCERSACPLRRNRRLAWPFALTSRRVHGSCGVCESSRSEEHTSELQSLRHLVCRLLLAKKINGDVSIDAIALGRESSRRMIC